MTRTLCVVIMVWTELRRCACLWIRRKVSFDVPFGDTMTRRCIHGKGLVETYGRHGLCCDN